MCWLWKGPSSGRTPPQKTQQKRHSFAKACEEEKHGQLEHLKDRKQLFSPEWGRDRQEQCYTGASVTDTNSNQNMRRDLEAHMCNATHAAGRLDLHRKVKLRRTKAFLAESSKKHFQSTRRMWLRQMWPQRHRWRAPTWQQHAECNSQHNVAHTDTSAEALEWSTQTGSPDIL